MVFYYIFLHFFSTTLSLRYNLLCASTVDVATLNLVAPASPPPNLIASSSRLSAIASPFVPPELSSKVSYATSNLNLKASTFVLGESPLGHQSLLSHKEYLLLYKEPDFIFPNAEDDHIISLKSMLYALKDSQVSHYTRNTDS